MTTGQTDATSRLIGLSTSASLSYSNNVIETAAKNGQASIATLHAIAGTGTDEHGYNNLMKQAIDGTAVTVVFKADSGTTYTGSAFIDSIEATAGVDSFATFSCSLKGTGALTQA